MDSSPYGPFGCFYSCSGRGAGCVGELSFAPGGLGLAEFDDPRGSTFGGMAGGTWGVQPPSLRVFSTPGEFQGFSDVTEKRQTTTS